MRPPLLPVREDLSFPALRKAGIQSYLFSFTFVNLVLCEVAFATKHESCLRGELILDSSLKPQASSLLLDECFFDLHSEVSAGGFGVGEDLIADFDLGNADGLALE